LPKLDKKDNEVIQYVRTMGVNLILDYDSDRKVIANDNDNDEDVEDAEAVEEDDDTTSVGCPMPNKTHWAMKQLSTF